ncbi:Shedu anti-phage system protein SduA domain-containing protein [Demequina sp.]|uniref:Shedu anti-phage system protein SduA domain-containing protein n=1 Tax=Demequina sp. TaxID=2050685 RepID=UPI003D14F2E1
MADRLESLVASPTEEQQQLATAVGLDIPENAPAPVVAVLLRERLADVLMEPIGRAAEIPETLTALEDDLGLTERAVLRTGSRLELSAWFTARYMLVTARGLRALQPVPGDVVVRADRPTEKSVISSIDDSGRVFMKGGRGQRAWPNHLRLIAREGESDEYREKASAVDAAIRNAKTNYSPSSPAFAHLDEFRVDTYVPTVDAIRELEDLLDSGESNEGPFQKLVERHPQLLCSLVIGNWGTYVLPQQRLGAEHVTDFLVMGANSLGPQWVAVELEAPRHALLTRSGELRSEVQHAVTQIQDWRDWLTSNVAYAHMTLHLHGITNSVPGLVIIGRDDPSPDRQAARSRVAEQQNIQIHSWDWVLRQAKRLAADGRQVATSPIYDRDEDGNP